MDNVLYVRQERENDPGNKTLLRHHRRCWQGHVYHMKGGQIPKDTLHSELASGKRATGRPQLRHKDVSKRHEGA